MADSLEMDIIDSNLVCSETRNNAFFADSDYNAAADDSEIYPNGVQADHGFESLLGFPVHSEESVRLMIKKEKEHLPRYDYLNRLRTADLDLSARREALDWIWKAYVYYGFGPLTFCLSVNYMDRFLSVYELPRGKAWTMQLLAVACLSLAAKVEETHVPQSVDLQFGEPKFIFEAKTIQRMELLVLSTLRWKMQAFTPCSFIDYFLSKTTYDQHLSKSFISRSLQLILGITKCIDFLEFTPSEIAAAAIISVAGKLQAMEIEKAITCSAIVEKERVLKCVELIRDLSLVSVSSGNLGSNTEPLLPQSPIGVLDAASLSFKSEEVTTIGSFPNSSSNDTPNTKRIKSSNPEEGGT